MIRIGMIGADSTHTESYTRLVNLSSGPLHGRAQVVKLWGEDADQARQKAAQYQIPQVVESPGEAIEDVDVVMVCNRYGDDHTAPARLALEAGVPTFVDKPLTNDLNEARRLIDLAAAKGTPLMSCSAVRYAVEVLDIQRRLPEFGPLNIVVASGMASGDFPDPRAKHPFFYGIHAVELLHTLLGGGAQAVTTRRTARCDVATVHYADGRQGVVNLLQASPPVYHAGIYGAQGWGQVDIQNWTDFYVGTLAQIIHMAEVGESPLPPAGMLEVMAILTALVRSAEQGGTTLQLDGLLHG